MPQSIHTFEPPFIDVPGALDLIRQGRMVIVTDDENRENEGDLTMAAEFATPEAINFMAKYGRGLICLSLTEERADHLRLFPMSRQNTSRFGTAFTETIEAREGVTTGISAFDRAQTIKTAVDPHSTAADLARPGHIFPLRARGGGVLVRAGQTEASVDLARMAGLTPAGVICEVMKEDGTMARVPDLIPFCREHGLRILTVAELIRYRMRHERTVFRAGETTIQTRYGQFRMIAYESEINGGESHIALVRGDCCPDCPALHLDSVRHPDPAQRSSQAQRPGQAQQANGDSDSVAVDSAASEPRPVCPRPVLVRVHPRCTAGDLFGADCHCRETLDQSMRMIAEAGCGVVLYLHNASRGFEIERSAADSADAASSAAMDSAATDSTGAGRILTHHELREGEDAQDRTKRILRNIGLGSQILSDLGIERIRLLSNTPMHIPALQGFGLEIVEQVALPVAVCEPSKTE